MPREAKPQSNGAHVGVNQRVLLPLILGVLVFLALLHALAWTRPPLMKLDRQLLDEFHIWGNRTPPRPDIMVLAIDDVSLTREGVWQDEIDASPALQAMGGRFTSWPRRLWAMTLDRLFQAGARQVFLDLTFFGTTTPEDDKALAEALQRHKGKVIIGAKFDTSKVSRLDYPDPVISGSETPEDGTWGYLNFWSDSDNTLRRARYHTLRSKVEKVLDKEKPGVPDPTERPSPSIALALARHVNVTASAEAPEWPRIRFSDTNAYPPVPLLHIFVQPLWENNLGNGAVFKDKIIFVGATAQELHDSFNTPLGDMPGVEMHAHALTALLAGSFIQDIFPYWIWLSLCVGAIIAWFLVTFVRQPVLSLISMWLLTAGAVWISFWSFNHFSIEASPLPLVIALNGCGFFGLTGNFLSQLRETRKLTRFIQRYHSPDRVAHLLKDRANLFSTLGGVERTVTILFSDVRGFTTLSEGMKPEQLVTQLNEYLSRMVEKVFLSMGSIDKFIGDAVMALWGSMPQPGATGQGVKQDALDAVTSAVAMREALAELNADWKKRNMPQLGFGIGVHQGQVVVGNIGSASPYERMELTVIGDNVNLASRLEGVTKEYGVDIIISDAVQHHVKEVFQCRSADLVQVKGKVLPVEVFTVMSRRDSIVPSGLADFERGMIHYRAGRFSEALDAMKRAAASGLNDALTAVYVERCESLMASPPENWNGVYVMKKK
ncbi:MAG: adenylate/guanylate cyclase domain-containing protein [Verrucomicrobia bacterium]|nr:adenylate/guanylate cyclase domain-containing protein [Verrucomicrobiota bacterium]